MYGWLSAELFAQGLKNAGVNPTRGSLLKALGKITTFTGGNLTAPTDPAAKTVVQLLPDWPDQERQVGASGRPAD